MRAPPLKEIFYKNNNKLTRLTNRELSVVNDWFLSHGLLVHPDKTRYIIHNGEAPSLNISIAGKEIIQVGEKCEEKSYKLLGIELDQHLTFELHIKKIHRKMQGSVSLIKRSKRNLPNRIKLMLYNSLVMAHVNYATVIWGCQSTHLKRLEITQKRALRAICLAPYNAHTQPLLSKTKSLSLLHTIELNYLKIGSNLIHKIEPETVRRIFPLKVKGRTRSADLPLFQIPFCKRNSETHFPHYIVAKTWNAAIKHYKIDMLAKMHIMAKNYKEMRLQQYKDFECNTKGCYVCK